MWSDRHARGLASVSVEHLYHEGNLHQISIDKKHSKTATAVLVFSSPSNWQQIDNKRLSSRTTTHQIQEKSSQLLFAMLHKCDRKTSEDGLDSFHLLFLPESCSPNGRVGCEVHDETCKQESKWVQKQLVPMENWEDYKFYSEAALETWRITSTRSPRFSEAGKTLF